MNPLSNQPQGCKKEKEDQKAKKQTESNGINAQACAIANMAITTLERIAIIWNQSMMAIFSMFNDQLQSHEAQEYFWLCRQKELELLQNCLKHNNAQTNILTPKPSGIIVASTPIASISPITNIIEEGNDHNVLDLVS